MWVVINNLYTVDKMFRKSLFIALFVLAPLSLAFSQKKEMQQAKDNIKAGKSLEATEASMRALLADSVNRHNEKIWLLLFDAVRKQYETVNEQMFLKQATDTAKLFNKLMRKNKVIAIVGIPVMFKKLLKSKCSPVNFI